MPSLWVFPRESWVQDPHPTNRTATCLVVELELVDETPCDNSGLSRNRQDWNRNRKIHARIGRRSLPSRRRPRRNDPKGNRRVQSEDPSSRRIVSSGSSTTRQTSSTDSGVNLSITVPIL